MSEATNRVLEAQLRRQKQHDKRQKEWETALKPTTIDGSGVLRQLGQQPVDNRQILPNTASLNRPIRPTAVPGGVVADWLPKLKKQPIEPVERKSRITPFFLLYELFDLALPPEPGPVVVPSRPNDVRYWLYRNNTRKPIEIPTNREWSLLGSGTVATPSGGSNPVTLADLGLTVGAYQSGGFGLSPWVAVWIWQKSWISPYAEPTTWGRNFERIRAGSESYVVAGSPNYGSTTNYRKFEVWIRDLQNVYISASRQKYYIYNAIGSWDINDRHGINYYEIPINSQTLSVTPTRFDSYPGFVGAADDWLREWPDIATSDPVPEANASNKCFTGDYGGFFTSYSEGYQYDIGYRSADATQMQDMTLQRAKILENSPTVCNIDFSGLKEYPIRYLPPDLTDIPNTDNLILNGTAFTLRR